MSIQAITLDRIRSAWMGGVSPSECAERLRVSMLTVLTLYAQMDDDVDTYYENAHPQSYSNYC